MIKTKGRRSETTVIYEQNKNNCLLRDKEA